MSAARQWLPAAATFTGADRRAGRRLAGVLGDPAGERVEQHAGGDFARCWPKGRRWRSIPRSMRSLASIAAEGQRAVANNDHGVGARAGGAAEGHEREAGAGIRPAHRRAAGRGHGLRASRRTDPNAMNYYIIVEPVAPGGRDPQACRSPTRGPEDRATSPSGRSASPRRRSTRWRGKAATGGIIAERHSRPQGARRTGADLQHADARRRDHRLGG